MSQEIIKINFSVFIAVYVKICCWNRSISKRTSVSSCKVVQRVFLQNPSVSYARIKETSGQSRSIDSFMRYLKKKR